MRVKRAFLGFVSHPQPRGALRPKLCLTKRFTDVRAPIILFKEGFLTPNFIVSPQIAYTILPQLYRLLFLQKLLFLLIFFVVHLHIYQVFFHNHHSTF